MSRQVNRRPAGVAEERNIFIPQWSHRDLLWLVSLIGVGALLPLVVAMYAGAAWIPHNDSWAHSRIAQQFAESGQFHLVGFNRASMVGMMIPLGIVAGSITAQHLFVVVCAALVVGFTYATAREFLPRISSLLVSSTVVLAPGFALLATSYMTDVPMMAAVAGSLFFGVRFITYGRAVNLWMSTGFGLWGVTIREQALAALAAVVIVGWAKRREKRLLLSVAAVVCVISFVGFEVWRRSIPSDDPPEVSLAFNYAISSNIMAWCTLLLICAPLIWGSARLPASRAGWIASAVAAAAGVLVLIRFGDGLLLGNYLSSSGAYVAMFHGTRDVIPSAVMAGLAGVSVVSAAVVASRVTEIRARPFVPASVLLLVFIGIYAVGIFAQTAIGQGMFERYLYPLLAPLAILLLRGVHLHRRRFGLVLAGQLGLAIVSALIATNAWASSAAIWATAQGLVSDSTPARHIDAGFAWVGFNSQSNVVSDDSRDAHGFWAGLFDDSKQCVIVSLGGVDDVSGEVDFVPYTKFIWFGQDSVAIQSLNECL